MASDRLFVPLNSEPFSNFAAGVKDVELRGRGPRFNSDTVYEGRRVELRRGYNTDDSLWGTIGTVWEVDRLVDVPMVVDYNRIHPGATEDEFLRRADELIGHHDQFILFAVEVDDA